MCRCQEFSVVVVVVVIFIVAVSRVFVLLLVPRFRVTRCGVVWG